MTVEDTVYAIRKSGLFTQVEPTWQRHDSITLVSTKRGVAIKVDAKGEPGTAHVFYDRGTDTYYSSGCYNIQELQDWWFPVMRDDRAWSKLLNTQDVTLAAELV